MNNKKKNLRYAITATHDLTCKWPRQVPLTPLWPTSVPSGHMHVCVARTLGDTPPTLLPAWAACSSLPPPQWHHAHHFRVSLGSCDRGGGFPPLPCTYQQPFLFSFTFFFYLYIYLELACCTSTATPVPLKRVSRGAERVIKSSDSRR